jgi:O-antigen ligase
MMLETIRDPFGVTPGQETVLHSPGALTGLVLDLLAFVPALLVAVRGMGDEQFKLRWPASVALLLGLGLWTLASVAWSADRFAAAASAARLPGAAAIAWTMIQCVREWKWFRVVCAALCGLLAVLVMHSIIYLNIDLPDLQKMWETQRQQMQTQGGIEAGSFAAQQLERKVQGGELMGFSASPNTLAALTACIAVVLMGTIADRAAAKRGALAVVAAGVLLVCVPWMLLKTQSKTAVATPVIGLLLIVAAWKWGRWLATHRRLVFWGAVGAALLVCVAVVGHGLHHGTLLQRSLTFRWHYWVASFAMWKAHWLAGTGFENFATYYLQYRLPIAPEEIRDPHNLLVRFATESGLVGLVLAIAWVLRAAWEATRPMGLPDSQNRIEIVLEPLAALKPLIWIALASTVLVILAGVDLTQDGAYVAVEVMRRGLYGALLLMTMAALLIPRVEQPRLEDRPGPLLLVGAAAALAVFLIHNTIDFAFFETGPMYLMMMLLGAVIGVREPQESRRFAWLSAVTWLVIGVGVAIMVGLPVIGGELAAQRGDSELAGRRYGAAAASYGQAFDDSLWLHNGDYLMRQGRAQAYAGASPQEVAATLEMAISVHPREIKAWLMLGSTRAALGDAQGAENAFEEAMWLNRTDIRMRIDAADTMSRLRPALAAGWYAEALALNDLLPADEPKRLSAEEAEKTRQKQAQARAGNP